MDTVETIIQAAGGRRKVADAIESTDSAVAKWSRNGIPERHWGALIRLTGDDLTVDRLFGVNEALRSARQKEAA